METPVKTSGTITPYSNFDPEADCKKLNSAMKGAGTDEKALIAVLCYRSNSQRQVLKEKYEAIYGKYLVDELDDETSGHFWKVLQGLMVPFAEYDAFCIHNAVQGLGTDEDCLIEILASRSNGEIENMKAAYKQMYKKSMEDAVASDTSGDFKHILVSLMSASRDSDEGFTNEAKALQDATALYNAGEKRFGTDEDTFNQIFGTRSYSHLREVYRVYPQVAKGSSIENAIKKEMSGDTENAFLAIMDVSKDRLDYFASRLYKSMKGLGTNDSALIRLMISRSETDLVQVKEIFRAKYKKTLYSFIKDDTSGDYGSSLLAICKD